MSVAIDCAYDPKTERPHEGKKPGYVNVRGDWVPKPACATAETEADRVRRKYAKAHVPDWLHLTKQKPARKPWY